MAYHNGSAFSTRDRDNDASSIGVGSRGARGAVAPLDFCVNWKFGKQVWSEIKAKILVFVWVIAVAPLTQTILLRQWVVTTGRGGTHLACTPTLMEGTPIILQKMEVLQTQPTDSLGMMSLHRLAALH